MRFSRDGVPVPEDPPYHTSAYEGDPPTPNLPPHMYGTYAHPHPAAPLSPAHHLQANMPSYAGGPSDRPVMFASTSSLPPPRDSLRASQRVAPARMHPGAFPPLNDVPDYGYDTPPRHPPPTYLPINSHNNANINSSGIQSPYHSSHNRLMASGVIIPTMAHLGSNGADYNSPEADSSPFSSLRGRSSRGPSDEKTPLFGSATTDFQTLKRVLLISDIVLSVIAATMALPLLSIAQDAYEASDANSDLSNDFKGVLLSVFQRMTPFALSFTLLGYLFSLHIVIFSWISKLTTFVYSINMLLLMVLGLAPIAQHALNDSMVSLNGLRANFAIFLFAAAIVGCMLLYLILTRFRHELSASKQDRALFRIFVMSLSYHHTVLQLGLVLGLSMCTVMGLGALWVPFATSAVLLIPKVLLEFFWLKGWKDAIKNVLRPDGYGKDRLNSFGDGVYAVSLVLTAINLNQSPETLSSAAYISCHVITFVILCLHWYFFLRVLKSFTGTINNYLFWFNHLHLMCVCLMPFSIQFALLHQNTRIQFYFFWGATWFCLAALQALTYAYSRKLVRRKRIRLLCTVLGSLVGIGYVVWLIVGLVTGTILDPLWYRPQ